MTWTALMEIAIKKQILEIIFWYRGFPPLEAAKGCKRQDSHLTQILRGLLWGKTRGKTFSLIQELYLSLTQYVTVKVTIGFVRLWLLYRMFRDRSHVPQSAESINSPDMVRVCVCIYTYIYILALACTWLLISALIQWIYQNSFTHFIHIWQLKTQRYEWK